jgi:hypothetical protein
MRTLMVIAALLTPVPILAQSACPTTASSNRQQFIPPAPNPAVLERGRFWFGSEKLWTALREDGHWGGVYRADLKVHRNKLPLYRLRFDWRREPDPAVAVTARRVGQPTTVGAILSDPPHGGFNEDTGPLITTAIDLPVGCWKIMTSQSYTTIGTAVMCSALIRNRA